MEKVINYRNNDFYLLPMNNNYYVSKEGEVYSTFYNKLLKVHTNNKGRVRVTLCANKQQKHYLLSRIMANVFLGLLDISNKELEVDHIDRNPENNSVYNLQVLNKLDHKLKTCVDNNIQPYSTLCVKCFSKVERRTKTLCVRCLHSNINTLTLSDIVSKVTELGGWLQAAKFFGCSDNGIRKKYRRLSGKDPKDLLK